MKDDLIDKYLSGIANKEEIEGLVQQGEPLEELDDIKKGIRLSNMSSKLELLKDVEEELRRKDEKDSTPIITFRNRIKNNRFQLIGIAASLLLLAGVLTQYFLKSSSIYIDDYYEFYPYTGGVRGNDSVSKLEEAYSLYNSKQFAIALDAFNKIEEKNETLFFVGISFMEIEEYEEAINAFQQYLLLKKEKSQHPANYYMGLCYLHMGDDTNAIRMLKKVKPKTYGFDNAQYLIKKLN